MPQWRVCGCCLAVSLQGTGCAVRWKVKCSPRRSLGLPDIAATKVGKRALQPALMGFSCSLTDFEGGASG